MNIYKTSGIVINRKDTGEADKIITVFTNTEGKLKAIAKGIRWILSKNSGHLELFNYCELSLVESRNQLDKITNASTIESFKNLRADLKKTAIAYFLAETIDKLLPEKEKNKKVFDLLLFCLRYLNDASIIEKPDLFISYFGFNLLSEIGYRPELMVCVHCRKPIQPIDNFFSLKLGGVICPSCARRFDQKSIKISKDVLKILRAILDFPLEIIMKLKTVPIYEAEVKKIAESFLRNIIEREIKSSRFLKKV